MLVPHPSGIPNRTCLISPAAYVAQLTQVAIVTGGNAGIGYETVRWLLKKNAKVYLASRSEQRAREAIAKLEAEHLPGTVVFLQLDLAELKKVKSFADSFLAKEQHLDLLFNNGGVMLPEIGPQTADGYELQLGTNALAHHYLTQLLLPALEAASQAHPSRPPRVCFTSSLAHRFASPKYGFSPEDPTGVHTDRPFNIRAVSRAYGVSKLANILSAKKFQREHGSKGISFTSVHPGILRTELMRDWSTMMGVRGVLERMFFYPASMGCYPQLYANTANETATKGGSYFVPWDREVAPLSIADDTAVQDRCTCKANSSS